MMKAKRIATKWLLLAAIVWLGIVRLPFEPAAAGQEQSPKQAGKNADTTQTVPPQEPSKPSQPDEKDEVKITPREAEELFHSIDEILAFDSKQTGLPIKREVKRKLTSREEVVSYLTKHMNDEDTQRLRRSELVLKKFGLLPRDFDLEKLLVELLREEVAGYYDPKTKTVNLLEWVPIEEQEPVMAHELTHALQDQSVGLQKWMKKGDKDLGEIKKNPTAGEIEYDEMDNAREAVIEGQAQAMMFQYALAATGHSIADSPDLVDAMESETLTGTPATKVFNEAPIFMKESLTFPYSYGMNFVIKLMQKGGKEKAFADVLRNPPHTTRQIMQPETYLADERIEPMRLPDFARDFKKYQKVDIGAMGEFDVAVLMQQYAGKALSNQLYPEWRGGYYYAARPRNDSSAPLALLYVSRWSSARSASEFAEIYARSLTQRYKKVLGEAVVDKVSSENSSPKTHTDDKPVIQSEELTHALNGRHTWTTEEGSVVIEEQGDTVFVSESLDAETTDSVEKEVFGK
jgi:hypothetical protein